MRKSDIDSVVELQRSCFPPPFPEDLLWRPEHLIRHLEIFPEGQIVALLDAKIVASASSLIITENAWNAHLDWERTVGGHFFANHDEKGSTLYGADISVRPELRRLGIGRSLYCERFELVKSLNLARFGTACRMPDFAASGIQVAADYAKDVVEGKRIDRTLTPLARFGLTLAGVMENYMEDEESGNAAALLEWRPN